MASRKRATTEKTPREATPETAPESPAEAAPDATEAGPAAEVSRETLEAMPARVVVFLRAVGTNAAVRGALSARGYDEAEHQQGWALLHAASGFVPGAAGGAPAADGKVAEAIATLDAWDEGGFRIARAALRRLHPAQATFVMTGLAPATGAAAVLGVKTFLDRLDALASSSGRAATRKDDHAALATLAKRGITRDERTRLRTLVEQAQAFTPVTTSDPKAEARQEKAYLASLVALRAWYEDWSDTARAVIKRRDHLIRLGLAQRKVRPPSDAGKKDDND